MFLPRTWIVGFEEMKARHLSAVVFHLILILCTQGISQVEEFCQWEDFRWSCDEGKFILVRSAWYGRRSLGRCLRAEYGIMGCGLEVSHFVSSTCNGRKNCSFSVTSLHGLHGCPMDLGGQLFVDVTCVSMMSCTLDDCASVKDVRVTSDPEYILANGVTSSPCHSASCSWWLNTDAGRNIYLSVLDYSVIRSSTNETSRGTRVCYRYAQIREEDGKSDLSGCSFVLSTKDGLAADLKLSHDYTRHRHQSPGDASSVYKSKSHRILLTLFSSQASGVQFIIVYQAQGCTSPQLAEGVIISQRNDSTLTMECVRSGEKWAITCIDNSWRGRTIACPQQLDMTDDLGQDKNRPSYGILLVVGLGILMGVIVGFTLLFLLICVMRSRSPSLCCPTRPQIDPVGNVDLKIEHPKLYFKDGDVLHGHLDEPSHHVTSLTFSSDVPLYCIGTRPLYEANFMDPSSQASGPETTAIGPKYKQRGLDVRQEFV